jgi:hypothetical protein
MSWVLFFLAQVLVVKEIPLTVLAVCFSAVLLWRRERGEGVLFAVGFVVGLSIEVGLGLIARSQHWENASLWGVPYWLPVIWGYGFVVMRRIGNHVVGFFSR